MDNPVRVFLSYSRDDAEWLAKVKVHLVPLERNGLIECWDDSKIPPGNLWREEIAKALNVTQVAILLVTPRFLASSFIVENELPPLLKAAQSKGVKVIPVIISYCRFLETPSLALFHSLNPPDKPLAGLEVYQQDEYLVKLTAVIEAYCTKAGRGGALEWTSVATSTADDFETETGLYNLGQANFEMLAERSKAAIVLLGTGPRGKGLFRPEIVRYFTDEYGKRVNLGYLDKNKIDPFSLWAAKHFKATNGQPVHILDFAYYLFIGGSVVRVMPALPPNELVGQRANQSLPQMVFHFVRALMDDGQNKSAIRRDIDELLSNTVHGAALQSLVQSFGSMLDEAFVTRRGG